MVSPTPTLIAMKLRPQTIATLSAARMSRALMPGTGEGMKCRKSCAAAITPKTQSSNDPLTAAGEAARIGPMTEEPESLILELLRQMRAELGDVRSDVSDEARGSA